MLIDGWINVVHGWDDTEEKNKRCTRSKTCHIVHDISHVDGPGLNPVLRHHRPARPTICED